MGEQMDSGFVQLPLSEYHRLKDIESEKELTEKQRQEQNDYSYESGIKIGEREWEREVLDHYKGWTRGIFKRSWFGLYRKDKPNEKES